MFPDVSLRATLTPLGTRCGRPILEILPPRLADTAAGDRRFPAIYSPPCGGGSSCRRRPIQCRPVPRCPASAHTVAGDRRMNHHTPPCGGGSSCRRRPILSVARLHAARRQRTLWSSTTPCTVQPGIGRRQPSSTHHAVLPSRRRPVRCSPASRCPYHGRRWLPACRTPVGRRQRCVREANGARDWRLDWPCRQVTAFSPRTDARARLVVLLLGDPHLLEGGEGGEDADPDRGTCTPGGRRS